MSKNKNPNKQLTEVELEIMAVIWRLTKCTVREVLDNLPSNRTLAYTSVATMMKILEDKAFLKSNKSDKALIYYPVVSREAYESKTLKHVAEKLFEGDSTSMVVKLLNESELSVDELKRIRKTLEERMRS